MASTEPVLGKSHHLHPGLRLPAALAAIGHQGGKAREGKWELQQEPGEGGHLDWVREGKEAAGRAVWEE